MTRLINSRQLRSGGTSERLLQSRECVGVGREDREGEAGLALDRIVGERNAGDLVDVAD
jgi:hypothetical protein